MKRLSLVTALFILCVGTRTHGVFTSVIGLLFQGIKEGNLEQVRTLLAHPDFDPTQRLQVDDFGRSHDQTAYLTPEDYAFLYAGGDRTAILAMLRTTLQKLTIPRPASVRILGDGRQQVVNIGGKEQNNP